MAKAIVLTGDSTVKEEISRRLERNFARVESLLQMYPTEGRGRRDVEATDLLRAAVVFLHATLEDLVRSVLEWKLPFAPADSFDDVPLLGRERGVKIGLKDLAGYRGQSVDEIIQGSVSEYLSESNFGHPGELKTALRKVGLSTSIVEKHQDELGPMMSRRHWIVHRADRNNAAGSGQHATRSLGQGTVQRWLEAVRAFGLDVLNNC
jgi:hypothetical protein